MDEFTKVGFGAGGGVWVSGLVVDGFSAAVAGLHSLVQGPHLLGGPDVGERGDDEGEGETAGEGVEEDAEALEEFAADPDEGGVDGDVLGDFCGGRCEGDGAEHPADAGAGVGDAVDDADPSEFAHVGGPDETQGVEREHGEGEAGGADGAQAVHEEARGEDHGDERDEVGELGGAGDLVVVEVQPIGHEDGQEGVGDHPADAVDHVGGFVAGEDGVGLEDFFGVGDGFKDSCQTTGRGRAEHPALGYFRGVGEPDEDADAGELDGGGDGEEDAEGLAVGGHPLADAEARNGSEDEGGAPHDAVDAAPDSIGVEAFEQFARGGVVARAADTGDEVGEEECPVRVGEAHRGEGQATQGPEDDEVAAEGCAAEEVVPEDAERKEDGGGGGDEKGLPVVGTELFSGQDGDDRHERHPR